MGKARVSPIKRVTIPNLEFQAATNGATLAKFVKKQHDITINSLKLWTDSTTVFHWINTPNQRHRVFANRLNLILDVTLHFDWRYGPIKNNPADDAARGYRASDKNSSSRWISGPALLLSPITDWRTQQTLQQPTAVLTTDDTRIEPSPFIDFSCCINLTKALKLIGYVLLFVENVKRKTCSSLSLKHLAHGFAFIIKQTQRQDFPNKIQCLTKKTPILCPQPTPAPLHFIDDFDFVRAKLSLNRAQQLLSIRYPVIINGVSHPIQLFKQPIHNSNAHCGIEHSGSILQ